MEIGRLKHRIKIYVIESVLNDKGEFTESVNIVATPYCEVSKVTIKEFREQDLDTRRETISFIIRYKQKVDINSGMRVDFRGVTYEIKAIETDFQDFERMMLKCEVVE
ncbi:phage head closure protein [Mammaliicoccus fleurettii]|uniref:Phage head closure protein n=1 Tax=Mammaliicoccus fleurettii TaxID=150056 RepID=A0ABS5MJF0_9STAP|nr:phage head closure protein [Mammaliicoccus fleurettii]MBL0846530.1 phage head closure protein [Mammaliicoccus fleurettii]MBS3670971.1 phage head closure protein [Mammaliicoccus fleurettii]MBS3696030.1 phage head closure protein [Mammaliicoccus fleurettii]